MTNFDEIKYYLAKKPFIYYKVDQNYIGIFDNSFEDKQKFSFGIDSEESRSFTTNSLVLFNINNERSFLGFLYSKKSVATVSKTIHIRYEEAWRMHGIFIFSFTQPACVM